MPRVEGSCDTRWDAPENPAIVFEGTVTSIEFARGLPRGPTQLVHLRDLRHWFKRGEPEVRTGIGVEDCGYEFVVGKRYLIEAYRDDDGGISTGTCTLTQPLSDSNESETLERLRELSGPSPGADLIVSLQLQAAQGRAPRRTWLQLEGPVRRTAVGTGTRLAFRGLPAGAYQLSLDPAQGFEVAVGALRSFELATDRSCREVRLDVVARARQGEVVNVVGTPEPNRRAPSP
jgi:hypothetical protein